MSTSQILYDVTDTVATITFNRPDRLNAWTGKLGTGYFNALDMAAADPGVSAIVVTGAGKGFCAGADMNSLQGLSTGDDSDDPGDPTAPELRAERHDYALSIPKPVIAAINGACAGLGFVHAMMCDIRFAADGAKFTSAFARRGLIAEHGISWMLPRLVGASTALDILMSGRVFLADEAKDLGLVTKVFPAQDLLSEAVSYARELGRFSAPWSMAQMKRQVWEQLDMNRSDALQASNKIMAESLKRPDFKEGVESFVARRDPNFDPVTGL